MREYRKEAPSIRLLFIDVLCMVASFLVAALIRYGNIGKSWFLDAYSISLAILLLVEVGIFYMRDSYTGFFQRGFLQEGKVVASQNLFIAAVVTMVMYFTKLSEIYSRLFYIEFFIINTLLTYLCRQYYKLIMLAYYKKSTLSRKMMVITTNSKAMKIIENLKNSCLSEVLITSLAIIDKDVIGKKINDIPVEANRDNLLEIIRYEVIDEVFISIPANLEYPLEELIEELESMGIKVQLTIDVFGLRIRERMVESFGSYHVLTFSKREFKPSELVLKRLIDFLGAFVGIVMTMILFLFLAPAIKIESRGPVLFSQTRIGKNGRRFRIYKFRSMYSDAEERKVELLAQNEMQGQMFKITNDPRITRIGRFIRKTSLDEFPQFLNVLKGDMSLVGTRPPTEDEFLKYESRHKRRLTMKPGLTGLWQTSGRSEIEDFEDVVKLDLEYIDEWSFLLDIKLLLKTVHVVLFRRGAR